MEAAMPAEQTRQVMHDYFTAMGSGHFSRFFTDNVTWTTVESNAKVRGRREVQDAILGLHARMTDMQTRQLVISDEAAYIEGSCAGTDKQAGRILYCVAYDLDGTQIASMRAYGALAAFMPPGGAA
jgi:hypothetical protein